MLRVWTRVPGSNAPAGRIGLSGHRPVGSPACRATGLASGSQSSDAGLAVVRTDRSIRCSARVAG
jgi:hypothetical protein